LFVYIIISVMQGHKKIKHSHIFGRWAFLSANHPPCWCRLNWLLLCWYALFTQTGSFMARGWIRELQHMLQGAAHCYTNKER